MAPASATDHDAEKTAILKVTRTFLECFGSRNEALMRTLILPQGAACLYHPFEAAAKNEEPRPVFKSLEEFVDFLMAPADASRAAEGEQRSVKEWEEGFDEVVLVDEYGEGELACVWCPFRYCHGEEVRCTGTDVFSMVKLRGKWLISGIADVAKLV